MRVIELEAGDGSHWTVELHLEGEKKILKALGKTENDYLSDDDVKRFFLDQVISAKQAEIVESAKG